MKHFRSCLSSLSLSASRYVDLSAERDRESYIHFWAQEWIPNNNEMRGKKGKEEGSRYFLPHPEQINDFCGWKSTSLLSSPLLWCVMCVRMLSSSLSFSSEERAK